MIVTTLVGLIQHTPRSRDTRGGERVLNLDVSVRQRVKKDGKWSNDTVWVDVVIFGARADGLAAMLKKGGQIGAVGELRLRRYDGRDGTPKVSIELYASNVWPLDWTPRPREEQGEPTSTAPPEQPPTFEADGEDDIPF